MAAKERMMLQGLWVGGNINLGFMVDERKNLASGIPNPAWRRYVPFEPVAAVVVQIFETFAAKGGNIRATLRHLCDNGPHFPNFDDPALKHLVPPGFMWARPLHMLKRGNVYMPGNLALVNMVTNPVYLGHWMHKERVAAESNTLR